MILHDWQASFFLAPDVGVRYAMKLQVRRIPTYNMQFYVEEVSESF